MLNSNKTNVISCIICSQSKRHKFASLLFVVIILLLPSCKKYLDKKSDSRLAVPSTLHDLQALLDNVANMNQRNGPSIGEASSDDYYLLENNYNSLSARDREVYTWQLKEYKFPNDWARAYLAVYNSNLCLEILESIPKNSYNSLEWNNIKGSALFYRAFNFLNLAWTFAKAYDESSSDSDLGIVIRLSSDFNVPSIRASVAKTYMQIINDAKESVEYLPDYPQHVMRPSKAAGFALLARAFLSMRKYDSAYKYADLCLQLRSELIDYNNDSDLKGVTSSTPFTKFNKETLFYSEMNTYINPHSTSRGKIDTVLYESYNSNDLRKVVYFTQSSGWRFKGNYTESTSLYFSGIATDEVYLIRAECLARKGMINEAMDDLNTLMVKRWKNDGSWVPFSAVDADEALNVILVERRKELLMRGLRWMDIKRLNKEGANIILTRKVNGQTFQLLPNSNYYALPLPADIIELTGIQQN